MGNRKDLLPIAFALSACWLIGKAFADKRWLKICKKKEKTMAKQEAMLSVYGQWVKALQDGQRISEYLLKNDFHKIAIYGLGRIGKQLCEELIFSKIDVGYIVDLTYGRKNKFYDKIPCYHPDHELPDADLMIVTIPDEVKEIKSYLRKKVTCPVKSMNDLLFVI